MPCAQRCYCQLMSIDRFERALRDDVLLDCIIAAETPPDIENAPISVERAEARIAHPRKCVPQLSAFDDVEVLRLSVQAARARADDMARRLPRSTLDRVTTLAQASQGGTTADSGGCS